MIEQRKKKDGHDSVDYRGSGEMHGEPHAGLGQKNAAGEEHDALVQAEKDDGESKTRGGMFGVQARSNGRGQITDDGFGNAVET